MPPWITTLVLGTCAVAFALCIVGALLAGAGIWEPKDPRVKTWLLTGLLFSVVGAVGSFAIKQFSGAASSPGNSTDPVGNTAKPIVSPSKPVETPTLPPPPPPPLLPPTTPPIPADVVDWANSALGDRPTIDDIRAHAPPACADDLASGQGDVQDADAKACVVELASYRSKYIAPFYALKGPYDLKLGEQEATLRRGGLSDTEKPWYNYVVAEIARLNGPDWHAFVAVDRKVTLDIDSCTNRKCR